MVIKKCEECGGQVSTEADTCPHCGYPLNCSDQEKTSSPNEQNPQTSSEDSSGEKRKRNRRWLVVVGIVVMCMTFWMPIVPLLFGSALVVTSAGVFIPRMKKLCFRLLRIDPTKSWSKIGRVGMYGAWDKVRNLVVGNDWNMQQTAVAMARCGYGRLVSKLGQSFWNDEPKFQRALARALYQGGCFQEAARLRRKLNK